MQFEDIRAVPNPSCISTLFVPLQKKSKSAHLVIQLPARPARNRIQVLIALQASPSHCLSRWGRRTTCSPVAPSTSTGRAGPAVPSTGGTEPAAFIAPSPICGPPVVWSSTRVAEASAAAADGTSAAVVAAGCPSEGCLDGVAGEQGWELAWWAEAAELGDPVHTKGIEVEAAGRTCGLVAVGGWEVAVAVCVGTGRSDVCWIRDIGIN